MEKYTKEQRREIYLKAAERVELGENEFCCDALRRILFNNHVVFDFEIEKKDFPEFFHFRPKKYADAFVESWWAHRDKDSRVNALLISAEMCK